MRLFATIRCYKPASWRLAETLGISNVVRRGGTYHFRRAVPVELRERIGRRELVRSLGSCNAKTARLLSDQLYGESEQLFELARQNPMLSDDQLARLVQDFYGLVLQKEKSDRAKGRFVSEEYRAARAEHWRRMADEIRKALGANRLHDGSWTAIEAAKLQGLKWADLDTEERHQCAEAVHRAGIDLASALAARYEGDFNFEPKDKLLTRALREDAITVTQKQAQTPAAAIQTESDEALLSFIYPKFIDTQVHRTEWRQQTANQAGASYDLFIGICGDKPIHAYARSDVAHFRTMAERMPSNYGKAAEFRGMAPMEVIAAYGKLPLDKKQPVLTQKTVKRHFSALSALWTDAVSTGQANSNIFSGHKFSAAKRPNQERDQWEADELKVLFTSPIWSGCLSEGRRTQKGAMIVRDEKFWIPLIGLYSGMRLEEICQLRTDDVQDANGIFCFDVNGKESRQLKNSNAVRLVPVHQELIKIGFLEYVASFGGKNSRSIFPALKPGGADNKFGHAFTKWFTRYRRDIGIYRYKLDFHSFRHTATTLMHQAGISEIVLDHLTGHSSTSETSRYTKGSSPEQLAAAIGAINPDLDFSHLYLKRE